MEYLDKMQKEKRVVTPPSKLHPRAVTIHKDAFKSHKIDKQITPAEIGTALVIAFMGFIFSLKGLLLWLNSLSPIEGLFVYFVIMYTALFILSHFGLIIWKFEIKNAWQVLGATMIVFAFFITVNCENPYVQYVTEGSMEGASGIFYQSEDGATWYFWNTVLGIQNLEIVRILTFMFTPFILTLGGAYLIAKGVSV